jgi:hypothetical protein
MRFLILMESDGEISGSSCPDLTLETISDRAALQGLVAMMIDCSLESTSSIWRIIRDAGGVGGFQVRV